MTRSLRSSPATMFAGVSVAGIFVAAVVWLFSRGAEHEIELRAIADPAAPAFELTAPPSLPDPIAEVTATRVEAPAAIITAAAIEGPFDAILEGHVFHAETEAPFRGAVVSIGFERSDSGFRHAPIGEDGSYRIERLPPRQPFQLRVRTAGEVLHREAVAALPLGLTKRDVYVTPRVFARGRVLRADTLEPLPGAHVAIDPKSGFEYSYVETRRDGTFVLRGVPPEVRDEATPVRVVASILGGYSLMLDIDRATLESGVPLEFRLGALGSVEGRVVDTIGMPIAGAVIRVDTRSESALGLPGPSCAFASVGGLAREPIWSVAYPSEVRSDELGGFKLKGLPHGAAVELSVTLSDSRKLRIPVEAFAACGETKRIEIVVPGSDAVVDGRVTFRGEPVIANVDWAGDTLRGEATTDESGVFRLAGVATGRVTVTATHPETRARTSRTIEVTAGSRITLELNIEVDGMLRGVVRRADGSPAVGVRVIATRWARFAAAEPWSFDRDAGMLRQFEPDASTTTDSSGAFRFEVADLTTAYLVQIAARPSNPRDPATTDARIVAPGTKDLELFVKD